MMLKSHSMWLYMEMCVSAQFLYTTITVKNEDVDYSKTKNV